MEMKINKNIYLKLIAVLLCIYIAISSFCQPKKVYANPVLLGGIAITLIAGMIAAGYARDAVVPAERLNELNEQATANLQVAFPDPAEYNKQLGILENLSNDLLAGKEVDWSKYSGKAIYAISKAVIDVLYPVEINEEIPANENFVGSFGNVYITKKVNSDFIKFGIPNSGWVKAWFDSIMYTNGATKFDGNYAIAGYFYAYDITKTGVQYTTNVNCVTKAPSNNYSIYIHKSGYPYAKYVGAILGIPEFVAMVNQNSAYVPSINKKTANKVKLPTRLPQSVINNYNTYINGESENLTINPTVDELPHLPENYNPVTDDPPDLDGYQDVTPDQEPTDTPDPTPTPTPTPSTPEYDGSSWIKPIGDFFAGLLSFLKDALIPTQTVDFSPLQNMSTDFGKKFPFSLPGDIGKLFGVLQAEPRRPEFQMTFDLSKVGVPGDPIVWDLKFEQWDGAAAIVKTALYIGFLIGLVFISKNFMKN